MIDPKSLRIGNRLMRNGLMVTIDAKTIYDIAYYPDTIGNQYEAVTLSPSLLERAGFEKTTNEFGDECYNISLNPTTWAKLTIADDYSWALIPNGMKEQYCPSESLISFHQIQNLYYSLTGQELELKP